PNDWLLNKAIGLLQKTQMSEYAQQTRDCRRVWIAQGRFQQLKYERPTARDEKPTVNFSEIVTGYYTFRAETTPHLFSRRGVAGKKREFARRLNLRLPIVRGID